MGMHGAPSAELYEHYLNIEVKKLEAIIDAVLYPWCEEIGEQECACCATVVVVHVFCRTLSSMMHNIGNAKDAQSADEMLTVCANHLQVIVNNIRAANESQDNREG